MRYTMIAVGSLGDVYPYILLGKELKKRGHEVTLTAFNSFKETIINEGLLFAPLSGSVEKFMGEVMKPGVNGFTFLRHLQYGLSDSIHKMLVDMNHACTNAQGVICTFFGTAVYSIAEKKDIPCVQTHYFPIDPNSDMPISSAPGFHWGGWWNRLSYRLGHFLISLVEKKYLTPWRKEEGMRQRKVGTKLDNLVNGSPVPTLYAFSPYFINRPKQWGENIYMTGNWLERNEEKYEPEKELAAFIKKYPKAIYIGFGSMVSGDMGETLKIVLDTLEETGIPAILSKGWGGENLNLEKHKKVYIGEYIPHSWLFENVSAVVHHGGAGTTAAGLLAGKPTLIIPFGGDQPFWGYQIQKKKLGPKPLKRQKLTVKAFGKKLLELTQNKEYAVNAKEVQKGMITEKGVQRAVDLIEENTIKGYKEVKVSTATTVEEQRIKGYREI